MQILRFSPTIIITGLLILFSCSPMGPLTPEAAFSVLKNAYIKNDANQIENLLSRQSREKIALITKAISALDRNQIRALSKKFGIAPEKLANMKVGDFILLRLTTGKKIGGDIIQEITRYKIIGKDIKGDRATLRVENGMELDFIREGPYWKLDLENL